MCSDKKFPSCDDAAKESGGSAGESPQENFSDTINVVEDLFRAKLLDVLPFSDILMSTKASDYVNWFITDVTYDFLNTVLEDYLVRNDATFDAIMRDHIKRNVDRNISSWCAFQRQLEGPWRYDANGLLNVQVGAGDSEKKGGVDPELTTEEDESRSDIWPENWSSLSRQQKAVFHAKFLNSMIDGLVMKHDEDRKVEGSDGDHEEGDMLKERRKILGKLYPGVFGEDGRYASSEVIETYERMRRLGKWRKTFDDGLSAVDDTDRTTVDDVEEHVEDVAHDDGE